MKNRTKIILGTAVPIAVLASIIGGYAMKQKESKQPEKVVTSSTKSEQKDEKELIKEKQLAYLKEHEQEIIDFVKAQSPKVESVQIDWDDVRWSEGGLFNPEYYINVFGRINQLEDSGWGVDIPINDDGSLNFEKMNLGDYINIGGDSIG